MSTRVQIYTDGSCSGNPGPGGWGVYMTFNGHEKELSGSEDDTTNNRMELTAAIKALEALNRRCEIDLYTDSEYVRNGITKWITGWKAKGWKGANKKPIKNVDLWQALDEVAKTQNISWHWVKGHAGNPGNERADGLALAACQKLLK